MIQQPELPIPSLIQNKIKQFTQFHFSDPPNTQNELPTVFSQKYKDLFTQLLFNDQKDQIEFLLSKTKSSADICGKTVPREGILWSCKDCSKQGDISCYCDDCFKEDMHKGHEYEFVIGLGGVCDCGDISLLQETTFCQTHRKKDRPGFKIEDVPHEYFRESLLPSLDMLMNHLHQILADHKAKFQLSKYKQGFLLWSINLLKELINMTELLQFPIIDILLKQFPDHSTIHYCTTDPKRHIEELDEEHECTCTILEITMRYFNYLCHNKELINMLAELSKQSLKFRERIGIAFFSNYEYICYDPFTRNQNLQYYNRILSQIMIDKHTALNVASNEICMRQIMKELKNGIMRFKVDVSEFYSGTPYQLNFDMGLILRNHVSDYLMLETNFIQKVLSRIGKYLDYENALQPLTEHILFEKDGFNILFHFYTNNYLELWQRLILRFSRFSDDSATAQVFSKIRPFLELALQKAEELMLEDRSFLSIYTLRMLSIILNKAIMEKYLSCWSQLKNPIELQKVLREYVMMILGYSNDESSFDEMVEKLIATLIHVQTFVAEVCSRKKKWILYGEMISKLEIIYFEDLEEYNSYPDYFLFFLFLSIQKPSQGWIERMFERMHMPYVLDPAKFDLIEHDSQEKCKAEVELVAYMLMSLYSNDSPLLLLYFQNTFEKYSFHKYPDSLQPFVQDVIKQTGVFKFFSTSKLLGIRKLQNKIPFFLKIDQTSKLLMSCFNCTYSSQGDAILQLNQNGANFINPFFNLQLCSQYTEEQNSCRVLKKNNNNSIPQSFHPFVQKSLFCENHWDLKSVLLFQMLEGGLFPIVLELLVRKDAICDSECLKIVLFKIVHDVFEIIEKFPCNELKSQIQEALRKYYGEIKNVVDQLRDSNEYYSPQLQHLSKMIQDQTQLPSQITQHNSIKQPEQIKQPSSSNLSPKERQAMVMKQFEEMRKNFATKRKEEIQQVKEEEEIKIQHQSHSLICAYCKETINLNEYSLQPFGKLASFNKNSIFGISRIWVLKQFKKKGIIKAINYSENDKKKMKELQITDGLSINCCGHFMHLKCSEIFLENMDSHCPICKTKFQIILPFISEKIDSTVEINPQYLEKISTKIQNEIGGGLYQHINTMGVIQMLKRLDRYVNILCFAIENLELFGMTDFIQKKRQDYISLFNILILSITEKEAVIESGQTIFQKTIEEVQNGTMNSLQKDPASDFIKLSTNLAITNILQNKSISENWNADIQMILDFSFRNSVIQSLIKQMFLLKEEPHILTKAEFNETFMEKFQEIIATKTDAIYLDLLPFFRKCMATFILLKELDPSLTNKIISYYGASNFKDELRIYLENFNIPENFTDGFLQKHILYLENYFQKDLEYLFGEKEEIGIPIEILCRTSFLNFDLIDLGNYTFDKVFLKYCRKRCDHCKSLVQNKAICLICGSLICYNSPCCSIDEVGEATYHTMKCCGDNGLFLALNKGSVLVVHRNLCAFIDGPFFNDFGENLSDFAGLNFYSMKQSELRDYKFNLQAYQSIRQIQLQGKHIQIINSKQILSYDGTY